jgi:hypothetical protein
MELLPPMDPSALATNEDLAVLRAELRGEMAELRSELRVELHQALREQTNRILTLVLPTMLSAVGLVFAAARLA